MSVIIINLDQFKPEQKDWVDDLEYISSKYFKRTKVYKGYLFLESYTKRFMHQINMLNEASSLDFKYQIVTDSSKTIEDLTVELDEYYDSSIVEPDYDSEGKFFGW